MNMITGLAETDQIHKHVADIAEKLSVTVSSESVKLTKQLLSEFPGKSIHEQLSLAAVFNAEARATTDCKKGINAFLQKEKLSW